MPSTPPVLASTPLLGSMIAFKRDKLALFERARRECGPISCFLMGPEPLVLVSSGELAHQILVTRAADFRGGSRNKLFAPVAGRFSLLTLDGEMHTEQRRLNAPHFTAKQIAGYAGTISACARTAVDRLRDGAAVDLKVEMKEMALRVLARVLFDIDDVDAHRDLWEAMETDWDYVEYVASSLFPLPLTWPTPRSRRTMAAVRFISARLQAMIEERRRNGTDRGDILSALVLAGQEHAARPDADEEVRDQAINVFGAGYETISIALAWAWQLLVDHPEVRERMKREVDDALGGGLPRFEDLPRLSYTRSVLREAMRLYPPGYLISRSAAHDVEIGGFLIRGGQQILIDVYGIHRDASVFSEPERFDPDRFTPERERLLPRGAYLPFGAGPHMCLGHHFATMEGQIVLATLAQLVEFERAPGHTATIPGLFLRPSQVPVVVRRRIGRTTRSSRAPARAAGM